MPVLTALELHKAFGARAVLDGVSLTLRSGERVGLLGVNGSGKTTLARVLAGLEAPDTGEVVRRRGAVVAYLSQDPALPAGQTARDVVMDGLAAWSAARARHEAASAALVTAPQAAHHALVEQQAAASAELEQLGGWEMAHRVEAMLGHLGIERPEAPVEALSGGERRRVALARTLVARPALAILDEPTNHLEIAAIEWLERYLVEEHPGAVLLITHDRYVLDRVVERTFELERGKLFAYDGGYEDYLEARAERESLQVRVEQNRQNFLRRELEWLRRKPKARTGKQKARIQRAEAARSDRPPPPERHATMTLEATRTGKTLLELREVSLDGGGRRLVDKLSLAMTPGDRIGIVGKNGCGKTTLLRAVLGQHPVAEGSLVLGQSTTIAFLDQERTGLDPAASIFDNVSPHRSRVEVGGRSMDVRSYLEQMLFDADQQRQPVGSLSGGERARVALAKMLLGKANLVLLDEPTNDLDVSSLAALEAMLLEFEGSALVVTHDRWFLDRVATSVLAFEEDGRVVRYPGNYETYRALVAERERAAAEEEASARAQGSRQEAPRPGRDAREQARAARPRGLTYAERIELDGILPRIGQAEGRVAALEAELSDPATYAAGGADVRGRMAELEDARAALGSLMARWEELEAKSEGSR